MLSVRLGLDVADQLEEMGIFDASTMTPEDARQLTNLATKQLAEEQANSISAAGKAGLKVKPRHFSAPFRNDVS